jgi:hypothetical protein
VIGDVKISTPHPRTGFDFGPGPLARARVGVPACMIAELIADVGDKTMPFAGLNAAYQERCIYLIITPPDFAFDSLRSDPRCAELARRVGFPQ